MRNLKFIVSSVMILSMLTPTALAANKYNEMDFVNTANRTLEEIAVEKEISVDEFKKMYGLPEDMPADTNEAAAFYNMTVENVAKMYGLTTDEFLAQLKAGSSSDIEINKDTLYDVAYGSITIKHHIGNLSFEDFKKAYELSDDITEDSLIGQIRNKVSRKQLAFSGTLSYFSSSDLLVMARGKYLDFDVAPTIINDRTMVPMRNIFEYFDAEIAWDGATKTIIAKSGDDIITMQVGQSFFFLNDEKIELDSPSVIINDRTLVPIRAISEALKREVGYNQKTRTVIIH